MIAIGSGGLIGKGYLEGTQTKGGFVPNMGLQIKPSEKNGVLQEARL